MTNDTLEHYTILNTRPRAQATTLTAALQQYGATVVELPALTITDNLNPKHWQNTCANIDTVDKIIFITANAANAVAKAWPSFHGEVFCIGPATNTAVQAFHQHTVMPKEYSVSGLLNLPQMLNLQGQSILIICGSNHNNDLKHELTKRGARVQRTTSYQVQANSSATNTQIQSIIQANINLVICTSSQGLQHIFKLFSAEHETWLLNTHLIVISEKMFGQALKLGWPAGKILRSNTPTTESILDTLLQTA
jgi:uroporphyrinogen III methyltransferase / synthase